MPQVNVEEVRPVTFIPGCDSSAIGQFTPGQLAALVTSSIVSFHLSAGVTQSVSCVTQPAR